MDLLVPFRKLDYWAIPYISMNGNPGSKTVPAGMDRDGDPFGGFTPVFSAGWGGPRMMLAYLAIRRAIRGRGARLAEKAIQVYCYQTSNTILHYRLAPVGL